ncbi:MAG: hypothetical protein KBT06_00600 [Prevotellaceae bacterium]|nr:hypothetical protein [Candidatus Colivivens equi]
MKLLQAFETTAQKCKDYVDSKHVELDNAIETHGMGWTSEEEVPAFNIEWDGNTEGREEVVWDHHMYKVSDELISKENIVGATVSFVDESGTESIIITEDNITIYDYPMYGINFGDTVLIFVCSENFVISDEELHKGVYFFESEGNYISSITKPASTVETVHQIDEKYIPSGGGALDTIKLTVSEEDYDDDVVIPTLVTPKSDVIANINNIKFAEIDGILYGFVMNRQMGVAQEGTYQLIFSGVRVSLQPDSVDAYHLILVIMDGEDDIMCYLSSITLYSEPEETD